MLALDSGAQGRGLETGFFDPLFAEAPKPARRYMDQARAVDASTIRLQVNWSVVAVTRPDRPRDPDDRAYSWDALDASIADARARGLDVLLSFTGLPGWAQRRKAPRAEAPTFRPDPQDVGAFATVLARRYARQVDYIQVWNEPNLSTYLTPQWERRSGKFRPVAPALFRAMLNASYPGVHAAGAKLVVAGTAPFGDIDPGGLRIAPVTFWKQVLKRKTRFDVFSHHPYSVRGPRASAFSKKDVAVPDVHRLVDIVARAVRSGKALPRQRKPTWVTEVSWDSGPPDPNGVPVKRHARWLAQTMHELWKQGVARVLWFRVRDQKPEPSFAETNQSGVYFLNGKAKPAKRAFAFPFDCERRGSGTRVWLRAPSSRPVTIVAKGRRVALVRPGGDRVASITVAGTGIFQAVSGRTRSIACRT